ncbi:hypothetical protein [Flavobacterium sp. 14A]|uniref:hypothetical protein n=1 Tax=Flavobacterium sp. 14A TaxID=2735896 RepID=UPI0015701C84|nr:hypothetical protein [Flavobacterium sp. 14A]NRT13646.1 putative membrane protein [Flavobacterium sp. 14A]
MLNEFFQNLDLPKLFNVLAGVIAFFVAYLKILPLIPRSSSKILSDIEVYNKATEIDIHNSIEIKLAIEREIYRKYKKPTKIYNYGEFFISLIILIIIAYFTYGKITEEVFDTPFYFLILGGFICIIMLMNSFNEPEMKNTTEVEETIEREPVFKFEIFSWSELISGTIVTTIFGFWTYSRLFKNGKFEFEWWSILTIMIFFTGITILTGAFKNKKKK